MKIFVDMYLDNNIGDDLMIKNLAREFSEVNFYIFSNRSIIAESFKNFNNIILIESFDVEFIKTMDYYFRLGGSIFQYNNWEKDILSFLKIRKLKKISKSGVKMLTIGANLGPFKTRFGKKLTKSELKLSEAIFVRDYDSYSMIKDVFKLDTVKLYDDIVFDFKKHLLKLKTNEKDSIFRLGVTAYRSTTNPQYNLQLYRFISNSINSFFDTKEHANFKVYLFCFDSENENDLSAAYHIKNMLNQKISVEIIPYIGDEDSFLREFSSMNKMIAVRFHGAILSDIYEIPYIPIAYSNKLENYINDVGHKHSIIKVNQIDNESVAIDFTKASTRLQEVNVNYISDIKNIIFTKR